MAILLALAATGSDDEAIVRECAPDTMGGRWLFFSLPRRLDGDPVLIGVWRGRPTFSGAFSSRASARYSWLILIRE